MANLLLIPYKKCFIYILLFLSILIILGTFTIKLTLKSMIIYFRYSGWLTGYEHIVTLVIIIALLFFTALFAKWLTIWLMESRNTVAKFTFYTLTAILLITSLIFWIPREEISFNNVVSSDQRFTGGPYPDAATLIRLKAEGYTTIISLLDYMALPQEPFLIWQEEKNSSDLGLKLIRIPMLTGNLDTIEGNKRIEALAKNETQEKYYVHGFHESDRVALFIRLADQYHPGPDAGDKTPLPPPVSGNRMLQLERGSVIQLDNHVIVAPQPTMDELRKYFLDTPNQAIRIPIRTIISVNPDDNATETREMFALIKSRHVQYFTFPIPLYPYDPDAVLKIVDKVKSVPDGVLIYSHYMPPQSIAISAFMISWLTHLPALPANLFEDVPLKAGSVKVIAPNVAVGPRPEKTEFRNYLSERGIRYIGYAGNCNTSDVTQDIKLARSAGITWICLQNKDVIMINKLKTGGPWYVYGPTLDTIEKELTKQLYQPLPDYIQGE